MGLFDGLGSGDIVTREQFQMETRLDKLQRLGQEADLILIESAVLAERTRCAAIARNTEWDDTMREAAGWYIAEEIERAGTPPD